MDSPYFISSYFPAEDARELCCSVTSAVISKLLYAIFIFIFAVVGATLGALTGAYVGAKSKIGCVHGATVGAIKGIFLSTKFFKVSLVICSSEDMATRYLLHTMNAFGSTWKLSGGLSKDSIKTIPKIRITEQNIWDSSNNRICCSICLQDFVKGEVVHSLPQCHHMFHISCIQKWLTGHSSCPLCRRNI